MVLQVECANVIAIKAAIERTGANALDLYAAHHSNYSQDEHLCRVGFMSTREALDLVDELIDQGVSEDSVAVVHSGDDLPAWLEEETVDGY